MKFGLALCAVLVFAAAACDTPTRAPDQDYRNFQTAVASASKDGYAPYWLGRGFTVGDVVFSGPYVNDYGTEVPGGGVDFNYTGDVSKVYGRGDSDAHGGHLQSLITFEEMR